MVRLNEVALAGLALAAGCADALPGLDRRQFSFPGINATPAPTANVVQKVDCWIFGGFFWGGCESSSSTQPQTSVAATRSTVTVRTGVLTTTMSEAASSESSTNVTPLPLTSVKAPVVSQGPPLSAQPAIPALSSAIAISNLPAASSLAGMINSMASIPGAGGNSQIRSVAGALTSAIQATDLHQASSLAQILQSMVPPTPSVARTSEVATTVVTPTVQNFDPLGAVETAACYLLGGFLFGGCIMDGDSDAVPTQSAPYTTVAAIPALSSAIAQSNLGQASHLAGVINSAVSAIPSASGAPFQSAAHGLTSAIAASNLPAASQFASILNSAASRVPVQSSPSIVESVPGGVPQTSTSSSSQSTSSAAGSSSTSVPSSSVASVGTSSPILSSQTASQSSSSSIATGSSSSVHLPGALTSAIAAGNTAQASAVASRIASIVNATPVPGASHVSSLASALTSAFANSQFGQASNLAGELNSMVPTRAVSSFGASQSSSPSAAQTPAASTTSTGSVQSPSASSSGPISTSRVSSSASSASTQQSASATGPSTASSVSASSSRSAFTVAMSELPSQVAASLATHHSTVLDSTVPAIIIPGTAVSSSGQSNVPAPTGSPTSRAQTSSESSITSSRSQTSSAATSSSSSTSPLAPGSSTSSTVSAVTSAVSSQSPAPSTGFFTSSQSQASSTSSAFPSSSSSVAAAGQSCTANGVTYRNGQQIDGYTIHCSQDNTQPGSVTIPVQSGGFSRCPAACDAQAGCVGWNYSGDDSGNCYLKTAEGNYTTAQSYIVSGFKSSTSSNGSVSSSVATSSVTSTASTQGGSSSASTPGSSSTKSAQNGSSTASSNGATQPIPSNSVLSPATPGATIITLPGGSLFTVPASAGSTSFPSASLIGLSTSATGTLFTITFGSSSTFVPPSTTSSTPVSSNSASCEQLGNGSRFNGYTIACNTDAPGGDIGSAQASSFADCFGKCTAIAGCSSFSFVGGNGAGTCYFKNNYVPSTTNPNDADSGFISDPSQASKSSLSIATSVPTSGSAGAQQTILTLPNGSIVTGQFVTTLPAQPSSSISGPSTTLVSSLSPVPTSGASCNANGVAYQSGQLVNGYTLHCSQDNSQPGSTVIPVQRGGFSQCPSACDAQAGCIGWTYSGGESGDCYLKTAEGTYFAAPEYIVSGFKSSASQASALSGQGLSSGSETSVASSQSLRTITLPALPVTQSSSPVQLTTVTVTGTNSNAGTIVSSGPIATSSSGSTTDCEALSGYQGSAQYVDGSGYLYNITCKHDIAGGDIDAVSSPNFAGCFSKCDSNAGCVGFSWLQDDGPGTCYLKGSQGTTMSTSVADVAVRIDFVGVRPSASTNVPIATSFITLSRSSASTNAPNGQVIPVLISSQSSAVTTFALPTVSPAQMTTVPFSEMTVFFSSHATPDVTSLFSSAPTVAASPLTSGVPTVATIASCQQLGSGGQIGEYATRCGTDAFGGDFMNVQASSFAGCIPLCDAQPQCIGYAFVGGSGPGICYLKSSHEPDSTDSNVDIAFKPAAGSALTTVTLTTSLTTPLTPTSTHTIYSVIPSGVIPGATGEVPVTILPSGAAIPSGNVPIMTVSGVVVAAPTTALPSTYFANSTVGVPATPSIRAPGFTTILGTTTITALSTPTAAAITVTQNAASGNTQNLPASGVIVGMGTVPISYISSGSSIPTGFTSIGTGPAGAVVVAPTSALKQDVGGAVPRPSATRN